MFLHKMDLRTLAPYILQSAGGGESRMLIVCVCFVNKRESKFVGFFHGQPYIASRTSLGASSYFNGSIEYDARPCDKLRTWVE